MIAEAETRRGHIWGHNLQNSGWWFRWPVVIREFAQEAHPPASAWTPAIAWFSLLSIYGRAQSDSTNKEGSAWIARSSDRDLCSEFGTLSASVANSAICTGWQAGLKFPERIRRAFSTNTGVAPWISTIPPRSSSFFARQSVHGHARQIASERLRSKVPRPHRSPSLDHLGGQGITASDSKELQKQFARKPQRCRPIPANTITWKGSITFSFNALEILHGRRTRLIVIATRWLSSLASA